MIKCLGRKIPSTSEILFTLPTGCTMLETLAGQISICHVTSLHSARHCVWVGFYLGCDLVTFSQALRLSGFLPWLWPRYIQPGIVFEWVFTLAVTSLHSARHCVWVGFNLGCDLVTFSQALRLSGFLPWLWPRYIQPGIVFEWVFTLAVIGYIQPGIAFEWVFTLAVASLHSARHCVWVGFYLGCDWLHSARHCVWVGFYLGCDWLHSARHCVWVGFYLGCDWLRCCPRRTSYRSGYPPRQTRSSPHRYKDWCCAESLEINHRQELRGVTRGYKQCLLGFLFLNRFIDYETSNR